MSTIEGNDGAMGEQGFPGLSSRGLSLDRAKNERSANFGFEDLETWVKVMKKASAKVKSDSEIDSKTFVRGLVCFELKSLLPLASLRAGDVVHKWVSQDLDPVSTAIGCSSVLSI